MKETVYQISAGVRLSIALIADTHNVDPSSILSSLQVHHPDIIAIAGDLLIGYRPDDENLIVKQQENVLPLVCGCVDIAPTFISLGNHEWMISPEDIEVLERTGAVVLDNGFVPYRPYSVDSPGEDHKSRAVETVARTVDGPSVGNKKSSAAAAVDADAHKKSSGDMDVAVNETRVMIAGLTSAIVTNFQQFRMEEGGRYPYRPRYSHASHLDTNSAWLSEFEKQDGYRILLSHHPEYWSLREPWLSEKRIDLVLSGHAHGGQWRVMGRGLYAPGQGWMPKFTSGVYEGEYGSMIVSRGLANTAGVPRLFNEPEIVYVEVRSND